MFYDLIAALISFFLVGPMQSDLRDRLAEARAPAAVVQQVVECATAATPVLATRGVQDPWWALTTTLGIWVGTSTPEAVLREAAPGCGPAMAAARPFLG
jgi:4-hydroxy-3-methylbut-2-enyl diphosphate reductase IspH